MDMRLVFGDCEHVWSPKVHKVTRTSSRLPAFKSIECQQPIKIFETYSFGVVSDLGKEFLTSAHILSLCIVSYIVLIVNTQKDFFHGLISSQV